VADKPGGKQGDAELDARPHALDIYEQICEDTEEEIERPFSSLCFSGVFGGFAIGLAPLGVALGALTLGEGGANAFVAALLYPIGYVAVILGRAQFFTENTLYPVMLSMRKTRYLRPTARLWAIVYASNLLGALLFAMFALLGGAFGDAAGAKLVEEGLSDTGGPLHVTFWSAVATGFLLALVAWLVEAAEHAIARIAVIYMLTFFVGLASLDHSIATTVEGFAALLGGKLPIGDLLPWLAVTTLGNIAGGVLIVAAINYGQVRREDDE
jgi:formate/nitrite transporter FocA (FNT family)